MPEQKPIPVTLDGHPQRTAERFRQLFPNSTPEQVARAAGVVDGMHAYLEAVGDSLKVTGYHTDGESRVAAYYHPAGELGDKEIHQEISWNAFAPEHRGEGYKRFADQLAALDKLPQVKKITVPDAAGVAGSRMFNGYYSWPRFGFNAPLAIDHWTQLDSKFWKELSPEADFHQLFDHPEGAKEWKAKGKAISDMEFDLSPDSEHRKRFQAYYDHRKQQEAAGDLGASGASVRPAVAPVSPTASQETADSYRTESRIEKVAKALRLRYRLKAQRGKAVLKYNAEAEAHPSVRGFQLEHALRRTISDPETTSDLKALSHTLLTQGVERSDAAYGINDEVQLLPEDHWLRKAGYNWLAIPHKLHLDAATGHLVSSIVNQPYGGDFNHNVNSLEAPSLALATVGSDPEDFEPDAIHRKVAEGFQLLKGQGHTEQDIKDSLLRHSRRMWRGVDRSMGRTNDVDLRREATEPKGPQHSVDRYKAVKYQTKPVYIKGSSGRYRFDNLHTVAAERAPDHPVYSGEEAKQLHQSPELAPDLTPEEAKAVEVFKSSSAVNLFNRDKWNFGHRPDLQKVSDTLDQLLERHPKTNRPLSLFRIVSHPGFADQFEGANEVGTVYSDKAHFSTGLDADYSIDALGGDFADNVLFQIRVPAGSKAVALDTKGGPYDKEREVILPRNARFRVVSVEPMGKGKYIVLDHLPEGSEESKPEQYAAKGKNPEGGLTVAEARRQGIRAGSETAAEAKKAGGFSKIEGKTQKRRKSFCARMCGTAKNNPSAAKDPESRLRKSLRIWGCRCGASKNSTQEKPEKYQSPALSEFITAVRQIRSDNQEVRRKIAEEQYKKLGLDAKVRDAIADWPHSASANTAHSVDHNGDLDKVRAGAALYGIQTNSPQLLLFHEHPEGADLLHKFDAQGSAEKLRQQLDAAGLPERTLSPTPTGWSVFFFDPKGQLQPKLSAFTQQAGYNLETSVGTGERIGDGQEAEANRGNRADYRKFIRQYEKQQGIQ